MSRAAVGLSLSLLLLVCLITTAPARLLAFVVPDNALIVQGFSGTLWRGQANSALVATGAGYIQLGRVHWSLNPLSLLAFSPSGSFDSEWGEQKVRTDFRMAGAQSLEFEQLDAVGSIQLLRAFLPLSVGGDIAVQLEHLTLDQGFPTQIVGNIVWKNAQWESARGAVPLGTYALQLEQIAGAALSGEVVTLTGAVVASGEVGLAGENYSVDISIKADADLNEQLKEALSLIAQAVPGGYRIKFDGQLYNP